ncbi:unnamed protein product [Brachionus calyciflorus]|uniref:Uncharacterized protein n=1 Tax=Brachionus calyciflorus TaxID=104777 RepID=A0A813VBR0_9BILA|nr:unnamed protein product [Brachionus calyciflorus]
MNKRKAENRLSLIVDADQLHRRSQTTVISPLAEFIDDNIPIESTNLHKPLLNDTYKSNSSEASSNETSHNIE